MKQIRFALEKGSRKYICPLCGKKRYVRYLDTETNEYLPFQYGRCDRESKCAYHLNPYTDDYDGKSKPVFVSPVSAVSCDNKSNLTKDKQEYAKGFIPYDVLKSILKAYDENVFIQNILSEIPFPAQPDDVQWLVQQYYLGTISKGYRKGALTIPFIDSSNNIRAVQVKQFDENNHTIATDYLHSMLEKHYIRENKELPQWLERYLNAEKKVSCLFGEHLIKRYPTNTIALVEAPKTAIIGSLYFGLPDNPSNLLWLAVYNKSSFSFEKVEVLKGRSVIVFPDLSKDGSTFNEWEKKSKEFESRLPGTHFSVSNLLEQGATEEEKKKGLDLADYLIQLDWREFRSDYTQSPEKSEMELAEIEKFNRRLKIA